MPSGYDIFISYCSADKALADKLVDILLSNGCNVSSGRILCTSIEGMGIPAGTSSFIEFLREKIQAPKLVILLLTENYFASTFCVCELGAAWGMGLHTFPLVVPPLKKSNLNGVLKVSQAGSILDEWYLDDLRDAVETRLISEAPTARWTVKRDEFLAIAPELIKSLSSPSVVDRAELEKAEALYKEALQEMAAKEAEIKVLEDQIDDLKKCKDAKQVRAVAKKYSSPEEEFETVCDGARSALGKLMRITKEAIYQEAIGSQLAPSPDDTEDVRSAIEYQQLATNLHDEFVVNDAQPKVNTALQALNAVEQFLEEADSEFYEQFQREHGYLLSFTNREFWDNYLVP